MIGAYLFIALLIAGAAFIGWDMLRSLKTGEATLRTVTVSRTNDRTFFWIYLGTKFSATAVMLYLAALLLALAFPDSHVLIWPMAK
jgi:hypothetical protein